MSLYLTSLKPEKQKLLVIAYLCCVAFLFFYLALNTAQAKTITYGSGPELVRIKHGGPTVFRFAKAVQTITGASHLQIKPANDADPSYMVLSVTSRFTNGTNDVAFFLTDGSVVKAKIVVSPNDASADSYYDFKSHETLNASDTENVPVISEIELLKAMARNDSVSGYKVTQASESFPSKSGVDVELIRIYKGSPFNGYVFRLTNTNWRKNVEVDVRHVTVGEPNLAILSQSDEAILYPKGKGVHQTLLRVVAKNTASSRDVILAMEAQETVSPKKGD